MNLIQSILLGVVEGLTEFIPVSSTFHLIFVSKLLGLHQSDFLKLFTVVIQSGAIISLLWLYLSRLKGDSRLLKRVITSFLPTAAIGFVFYPIVKDVFFDNLSLQLFVFAFVGTLFIIIEHLPKQQINASQSILSMTYSQATLIGLAQSLAIVPGVSRSGSILLIMLLMRYSRSESAEYAFMLSLPTILSATALDLYKNQDILTTLLPSEYFFLFIGLLTAFISALWVMRWLIKYLSTHTLKIFGYYRVLVAVLIFYFLR